ncbi:MAG: arginase family protein [Bacilli bacterium]|nr:arginase family protein [Bacilli bacterium]
MKTVVMCAESDLGVHIDGASLGPKQLINDIKSFHQGEILELAQDTNIIKSKNLSDRRKNEYEIDKFNTTLFKTLVDKKQDPDNFIITIGGDETVSIPSCLADKKVKTDVGLIYFTGSSLYDTFETTQNGNIKDLTIAAITGYKTNELRYYSDEAIPVAKSVIIGPRDITDEQKDNLRYAGITYFTTEDIKEKGLEEILNQAFEIANYKTKGVHISFSLSLLDPNIAPGVSIPVFDGLDDATITTLHEELLKHIDEIISYDLLDFNPLRDIDRKTEQIAVNILAQMISAANHKNKLGKLERKY